MNADPPQPPGFRRPHEVPYRTLSPDTDPKIEAVQLEIFRRMPAWEKVRIVEDAILSSRELALSGLRQRHPDADPKELHHRLFGLIYGEELATRVYGLLESPSDDP